MRIIVILKWRNQSTRRREYMLEYAVFIFCMIGCGYTCYALGKQEGIETTIEHLVDEGMLEIDE